MTLPVIIFCLLIGAVYGCIAHLIVGGNVFTFFIYMLVGIAGFFFGQYLSSVIGADSMVRLGTIRFGWATIGSVIALVLAIFLSKPFK